MALSKTTTDHDEIRKWAEARNAIPAEVASTHKGKEPGILRFKFPEAPSHNDDKLREISWDDFFKKFDESDLEFVYQDKTADGKKSNFNKFVYPEHEEHTKSRSRSKRKAS
ncbi:MAG TPA: hypothetical protein VGM27_31150 [Acidobacteriaceae bacterium]|jgi:hypothetical protein